MDPGLEKHMVENGSSHTFSIPRWVSLGRLLDSVYPWDNDETCFIGGVGSVMSWSVTGTERIPL